METRDRSRIESIWRQTSIPVIYRGGKGKKLLLRLPYREDNRHWLKSDKRNNPEWDSIKKHWVCPNAWFNDLVKRSVPRWGKLYIIQPYREQEKCAPACWNAEGHECQCSCMGANHGSQSTGAGWAIISDTFATKWDSSELACRLLTQP
jgi:hypothetical protein